MQLSYSMITSDKQQNKMTISYHFKSQAMKWLIFLHMIYTPPHFN